MTWPEWLAAENQRGPWVVAQQVVEKGLLPFPKLEKQTAWSLLFSQNQRLKGLRFCRNVHVSMQTVEMQRISTACRLELALLNERFLSDPTVGNVLKAAVRHP